MRFEKLLGTALALFLVGGVSGVTYQVADGGSQIPPPTIDGGSQIPPPQTADGGSQIPPPTAL